MKNLKKLFALLLVLVTVFSLTACGGKKEEDAGSDKMTVKFNTGFDPDSFDPQEANVMETSLVDNQCYDYLYRENLKGDFDPSLATGYTLDDSGTVYTFTLRDGIKFADGSPIKASDVVFSWTRALDPENAFEYAYQLYYIKNGEAFNAGEASASDLGLRIIDDKTLEVTLERPTPFFVSLTGFVTYGIVSEDFVTKQEKYGADVDSTLASGPFMPVEFNKGQYVRFEKNPNYWDAASVKIDELYFYCVSETSTELTMFETGNLDMTYMSFTAADTIRLKDQLLYWPSLSTRYIMCNNENGVMADPNVRKALAYALDVQKLCDTVVPSAVPCTGFVPNDMAAVDDTTKVFRKEALFDVDGDVELAKKYLADAGFPNGEGFPTDVSIVYTTSESNKAIAEALVEMWRVNLGITIKAENLEGTVRRDRKNSGDYYMSLDGWTTDYLDPYSFMEIETTGNIYNQGRVSNAEYDRLVAIAASSNDQAERQQAMEEAEKVLITDIMGLIPLYNSTKAYVANPKLKDVVMSLMGGIDFKSAYIAD
ncbi:MAG: hypothetical protein IIY63_01910 [Oscillospiraceae bacterium]|nr:hypothetical protein [Oscillospiraceae bacterium]